MSPSRRTIEGAARGGNLPRRAVLLLAALLVAFLAVAPRADAFVFWTKLGGIGRANLDGTGVDQSFITLKGGRTVANGVAVDASHVYWSHYTIGATTGAIGRANLDGTKVDGTFIPDAGRHPGGVAVDDAHIYWANAETTNSPQLNGGSIGRANLDGSGVDQQFIPGGSPFGVSEARGPAVNASHIYWSETTATIGRANLDGTGIEDSFIEFPGGEPTIPLAVAVDSDHVYWANLGEGAGPTADGTIGRASIDGTGVERGFLTGVGTPTGVAVDDAHIYWTHLGQGNPSNGTIGRASIDGTGVERGFITGVGTPSALAVDSSNDFSFGQVKKDESTGTATLTVKIAEGPGKLRLAKSETLKADKEGIKRVGAPPRTKLAIRPKGKARKRLNKKGKATVKVRVTYSPAGGSPKHKQRVKTITLVER